MSRNIASQPTVYNGIQFRSKLEAKTAQALDIFGMPWQYEPQGYKLSNGMWYKPDFWLVDAHQFVECKGNMKSEDSAKILGLLKDTSYPVLVLGYENAMLCMRFWNESNNEPIIYSGDDVALASCAVCGNYYFYSPLDTYKCPCCGAYDGDCYIRHEMQINSGTRLFDFSQWVASCDPVYEQMANNFNKEV